MDINNPTSLIWLEGLGQCGSGILFQPHVLSWLQTGLLMLTVTPCTHRTPGSGVFFASEVPLLLPCLLQPPQPPRLGLTFHLFHRTFLGSFHILLPSLSSLLPPGYSILSSRLLATVRVCVSQAWRHRHILSLILGRQGPRGWLAQRKGSIFIGFHFLALTLLLSFREICLMVHMMSQAPQPKQGLDLTHRFPLSTMPPPLSMMASLST